MNSRRRQRGLNIIEIVVTLAIVALVTTLGMPMYTTWLQNSQMRASAESIMAGLNHARVEAVRANNAAGVRFSLTTGNAWDVTVVSDGTVVQKGGGVDLAKNAVVTSDGLTDIIFTPLGQTNPAANVNIDVTHLDPAQACVPTGKIRCLRVQVRSGGMVRMCDPSVGAAGDPRRCLP